MREPDCVILRRIGARLLAGVPFESLTNAEINMISSAIRNVKRKKSDRVLNLLLRKNSIFF